MTDKDGLIDKLNLELNNLNERRINLAAFISSNKFDNISTMQQKLLKAQLSTMNAYSKVLDLRINDLEDNLSDDNIGLFHIDSAIKRLDPNKLYWIKFKDNDTDTGYLNIDIYTNKPMLDNNSENKWYITRFTKSQINLLFHWDKLGSEPFNWDHAQILEAE